MSHFEIPLYDLNYGEEEQEAVRKVLASGWISTGRECVAFENEICDFVDVPHGVAVSSCTAALTLALHLAGIGQGDEVIVPSLTFVATANVVRAQGAKVVFADIHSMNDWTISPEDAERKITPATKAIIAVHYAGFLSDMKALREIAERHNLALIEDAAHGPLAGRDAFTVGDLGDYACLSFYSNKNIAVGEGGMLLCRRSEDAKRARLLRAHGLTSTAYERAQGQSIYDVVEPGYNFRLDDIHAALGRCQLRKYRKDLQRRAQVDSWYREGLAGLKGLVVPFCDWGAESGLHIFPIYVGRERRDRLVNELKKAKIQTSYHYAPIHKMEHYRNDNTTLRLTEKIESAILTLPFFGGLELGSVDRIIDVVSGQWDD